MNSLPHAKQRWREICVDIWALNSFSYAVAFPIEILIAGMSWQEHLQVRLVALVLNTLVAGPFGWWRQYLFQRLNINSEDGRLRLYFADTLVFLSFQLPLYIGNMILGGAGLMEILKASLTVSVIAGCLGRPYGRYLDFLRARFKLQSAYAKS